MSRNNTATRYTMDGENLSLSDVLLYVVGAAIFTLLFSLADFLFG